MVRYILLATILVGCTMAAAAQSVVITPKKTVYTRPKPDSEFKKTFTVTYPNVKAATPALSRKIEEAISYLKILQLNVREELTEVQWLEEANYEVGYNDRGILVITLSMHGTAAYPDGVQKTITVNLKTGERITQDQAFTDKPALVELIQQKQKTEIAAAIEEIKKDPDASESDPKELFAEEKFSVEDLVHFAVDNDGVTFIYDYGFPHVIEALEPEGRYRFSWGEIARFVRPNGPFAQFISK